MALDYGRKGSVLGSTLKGLALLSLPIQFVNVLNEVAALALLRGADFLSVLGQSQRCMEVFKAKRRVNREYRIQYPNPLRVSPGEKVIIGREDDEYPGWKWCRASSGLEGWIPVELLSQDGAEAIVLREYSAQELAVDLGEEVEIEDVRHKWLLVRNSRGQRGWIPASHVDD